MSLIDNLNSSKAALIAAIAQQTVIAQQIQVLQLQLSTLTTTVNQAQATFNSAVAAFSTSSVQVADASEVSALQTQLTNMGATPIVTP